MATEIREPLRGVSEALDTELKSWLDLGNEHDAAVFAKAILALRNNNGGRLIIGVDDRTASSLEAPSSLGDLPQVYHVDRLTELLGRYALQKFEVRVEVKEYQARMHPEIIVPGGIATPALTRRGFKDVLRQNAVYVRTISKGRVGSCEPVTDADWDRLLAFCFDNREANIGRFLRRHLPAIINELGLKPVSSTPTGDELAKEFLELGRQDFGATQGYL